MIACYDPLTPHTLHMPIGACKFRTARDLNEIIREDHVNKLTKFTYQANLGHPSESLYLFPLQTHNMSPLFHITEIPIFIDFGKLYRSIHDPLAHLTLIPHPAFVVV
jgi:hypothetical protein